MRIIAVRDLVVFDRLACSLGLGDIGGLATRNRDLGFSLKIIKIIKKSLKSLKSRSQPAHPQKQNPQNPTKIQCKL